MWLHGGTDSSHPLSKLVQQHALSTMEHDVGESNEIEVYDLLGKKYNEENMREIAKVPHVRIPLVFTLKRELVARKLARQCHSVRKAAIHTHTLSAQQCSINHETCCN